jgi:hypothetical protein
MACGVSNHYLEREGMMQYPIVSTRVVARLLRRSLTCSFPRQAYRHNEAIHLSLKSRLSKLSESLALIECDRISSLFFATSGDTGLYEDVISSCAEWQLGRFCQSQVGVGFLYVTAAAP